MIKAILKKAASLPGAYQLNRHLTRHRPAILMYHGLTTNPDLEDWTQVDVNDFMAQMHYLRHHYHPVSLRKVYTMLQTGRIEPHAVALTFDDGYKSNFDLALPILKDLNIPATVFVASDFILRHEKHHRYLWPDFITALLKSYPHDNIDLGRFNLGQYDLSSSRTIYRSRSEICEILKSVASSRKDEVVSSLYDRFGDNIDHDSFPDYCPMSMEEVRKLSAESLITIGAHSRSHPILSQLETDDLHDEIVGGKTDLEELTGSPVTEFAYPNGRWCDIDNRVVDLAARHFLCAVTTEAGLNHAGQDKYLLRRIGIGRNLSVSEFGAILSGAYYWGQKTISRLQDAG
jgi:peptidoglycan/xylan/chitin deacetylase (PgdA/CDA1 family)